MTMIRHLRRPGLRAVVGAGPGAAAAFVPLVQPSVESVAPVEPALVGQAGVAGASATALQILNDRFARGEIGQEEYLERRKTITGS
jgi:hypothetical protein